MKFTKAFKKQLDEKIAKLKAKSPPTKDRSGGDSKKNDLANMSLLDELRNESVHSGKILPNDDELMDQVFGDENSLIDDDNFMEDDPDHGFGEEESGTRNRSKKNNKMSKTMQAKDQFSED